MGEAVCEFEYPDKRVRPFVWRKSGGRCWYCGCELDPWGFHVDHFEPRSKGGSDKIDNLVPACPSCNLSKHDRWIWEWSNIIEQENGLDISDWMYACIKSEGLDDLYYSSALQWKPPVVFWFEKDHLITKPYKFTVYKYKGWSK